MVEAEYAPAGFAAEGEEVEDVAVGQLAVRAYGIDIGGERRVNCGGCHAVRLRSERSVAGFLI